VRQADANSWTRYFLIGTRPRLPSLAVHSALSCLVVNHVMNK
jgi:hypothetical protein